MMTGAFSRNVGKLFSELELVTDNLFSIYAEANREVTERKIINAGSFNNWISISAYLQRQRVK